MALSSLTSLQIILVAVVSLNLFIWVAFILWRILFIDGVGNASRRYVQGLRALFRMTPSSASNETSTSNREELGQEIDEPPPYEEAVKYPSISSLLTMNTDIGSPPHNGVISSSRGQVEMTSATSTSNCHITRDAAAALTSTSQTTSFPISVQSSGTHRLSSRSLSCGHIHSPLHEQQQPQGPQETNSPKPASNQK